MPGKKPSGRRQDEPLKFRVTPHIVEDLGLNLYTSLPRVLVEFVANAYDADSPGVDVRFDKTAIEQARTAMRMAYRKEKRAKEKTGERIEPLATRVLPESLTIVIEDSGIGMSRGDLAEKFLVAGRRRRREEPESKGRTPNGRAIMGRKGLGKLAGFGVAKIVTVTTRKAGESHATRIVMNYEDLIKYRSTQDIEVPEERLRDGGGISKGGTRIVLSRLLYDPLKSRAQTIEEEIAEHFELISPTDFKIRMNKKAVRPIQRTLVFAWPLPDVDINELVEHQLDREGGGKLKFRYRIRFTGENEALPAQRRGVRVYAHKRLAAAPSLLNADTNMHGFRMTDYLDGIVEADFIDDEDSDYIATDRQTLRWESPLLAGVYDFLSKQIEKGCYEMQKVRDNEAPNIVKKDQFTLGVIESVPALSNKDRTMAFRFAATLKNACKRGVKDPIYRTKLPALVRSLGHGNILTNIAALAKHDLPDIRKVAAELIKLTADELEQFISTAKGRLFGVQALDKIVSAINFGEKKEEKVIQKLFEKGPWMVNPTFTQFLTADVTLGTMFRKLAEELEIGPYAKNVDENSDDRPDLVTLIGNVALARLVIVELKAPNVRLENKHLDQLKYYMERSTTWLRVHQHGHISVQGELIGSLGNGDSKAKGVVLLMREIREAGPATPWRVRDFQGVLADTKAAHHELLELHDKLAKQQAAETTQPDA